MKQIDDYDLYEQDFDEWWKRGREAFGLHEPPKENTEEEITLRG